MTITTHDRRRYPAFTIGDRLRKARTLLGEDMDTARFADLIGVSRNTVTNYELERTSPDRMKRAYITAWAMATGVDIDWLWTGVTDDEGPRPELADEGLKYPEQDSNLQPTGDLSGNRTCSVRLPLLAA